MIRKRQLNSVIIFLMTIWLILPGAFLPCALGQEGYEPSERPSRRDRFLQRDEGQTVGEAGSEIGSKLQVIFDVVNARRRLEAADIEIANKSLRNGRRYLKRFNAQEQCQYYLLSAWVNYYAGNYKKALRDAIAGCKANPENQDAQITQAAMALLNKDYNVFQTYAKKKSRRSVFGQERDSLRGGGLSSAAMPVLQFNMDYIRLDMLGKKMPPLQLNCLNGSTFSYTSANGTLCVLFWKLSSDDIVDSSRWLEPEGRYEMTESLYGRSGMVRQPSEEMRVFAELFLAQFDNPKLRFLGINIDSVESKQNVMTKLLASSWPWAQVMAGDARNAAISQFAGLKIEGPTFAIVGPEGSIRYAGVVSGFLPQLILDYALETTPAAEPPKRKLSGDLSSFPALGTETEQAKPSDTAAAGEEELNPHAEKLYQWAVTFKKIGRKLGNYNEMVECCRNLIEQYPHSPQAKKARMLLRQLPEKDRRQYKITDDEMGL